jgi:hypothetical protein
MTLVSLNDRALAMLRRLAVLGLLLGATTLAGRAHDPSSDMTQAATNFLAALKPEQRARAQFDFAARERKDWHFIPRDRVGLPFQDMTPTQRHLAYGLLSTALSHAGYLKTVTIMSLEDILKELEQGRGPVRETERYFVTLFGEPGVTSVWSWRIEGHHVSLNYTLTPGKGVAVSPSFLGANPAEVRQGPRAGLRGLAREEDLGRALAVSLDAEQRRLGLISETAPPDIILSPGRNLARLEPGGIPFSKLKESQQRRLRELVDEYVQRHRPELAERELRKIEAAGWPQVEFAWAGALEQGRGCYYRIQGPCFVLEFDNTQNEANHIHTVWRDLKDDFGEDLLRRHYEQHPHGR